MSSSWGPHFPLSVCCLGLATPVGYALELFRLGPASRVLVIFIYLFILFLGAMLAMLDKTCLGTIISKCNKV